jgi:hypothetical protein
MTHLRFLLLFLPLTLSAGHPGSFRFGMGPGNGANMPDGALGLALRHDVFEHYQWQIGFTNYQDISLFGSPANNVVLLDLTAGPVWKNRWLEFALKAGPGYVTGSRENNDPVDWWDVKRTVKAFGLSTNAELVMKPFSAFGIGIAWHANTNSEMNLDAFLFQISLHFK